MTEQNAQELNDLRQAVELMDSHSQNGFGAISLIAKLTLSKMESPKCYSNMGELEDVAEALTMIKFKAQEIMNIINCQAEEVGCNYVDDASRRRSDAYRKNHEAQQA